MASAVLAVSAAGLAACSEEVSTDDHQQAHGTYVAAAPAAHGGGRLAKVTIDGSALTYDELSCDGTPVSEYGSVGTINDDQTQVTWTAAGRWTGSDPLDVSPDSIQIGATEDGENTFVAEESEAGETVLATHQQICS